MERQAFILTQKKTFRHNLKLYIKDSDGKIDKRNITFTTEHKVKDKERSKRARKIAGEYSAIDEKIIDALYRDTGYGKTFVHVDDPEGKRKRDAFVITTFDAKKIALRGLFKNADLKFDESKSAEVLTEEYRIHISAQTDKVVRKGDATQIPHEPVDVKQQLADTVNQAHAIYEEKYGEPVPEDYVTDLAFLSSLADPKWDAKAFMAEKDKESKDVEEPIPDASNSNGLPDTAEALWPIYKEVLGVNVANPKKNDPAWMKKKILEKKKSLEKSA